ncbi:MAG: hypothetical protein EBX41_10895, partial [Chitinophagia bacterium]|nr:hypothetical protein [Chitinophagia bacterium]
MIFRHRLLYCLAMKIALVTNNYKPYSGGVVSAIDVLAQSLVQVGHQVFIVTLDFEGHGNSCDGLVSIIRIFCPIRFKYKTNHIAIPWFPDQAILQILSQIKPDIIHTHHPFLLGKSALKAGQRLKIPVVFTYHSQYEKFSHWVPLPEIFSANLIRNAAFKYCQKVSGIIAPSSFIYNQLTSCNLQRPVSVIPSAVSQLFLTDVFAIAYNGNEWLAVGSTVGTQPSVFYK